MWESLLFRLQALRVYDINDKKLLGKKSFLFL